MTKELVTKAIETLIQDREDELLELDHWTLMNRCLEYSGCLDRDPDSGEWLLNDFLPLRYAEREDMRNWLIERRFGELEGQDLEDLLDQVEIVERPKRITQLLKELRTAREEGWHDSARKIR